MGRRGGDNGFIFDYSEDELHWLAGYLEGEGCFRIQKHKRASGVYRYPTISITSTDFDVIARAAEIMDASVPYSIKTGHKATWQIRATGWGIMPLLEDLAPLMGERRRAAIESMIAENAANKLNS